MSLTSKTGFVVSVQYIYNFVLEAKTIKKIRTYTGWLFPSFIMRIFSAAQAAYVCTTALSLGRCRINWGNVDTTNLLGRTVLNVIMYFMASAFNTARSLTKIKILKVEQISIRCPCMN